MGKTEKAQLRAAARAARDATPADERAAADAAIAQAVLESNAFAQAPCVLTYCSMGSEVDTHAIIREALRRGKTVALPRCRRGERALDWHVIEQLEDAVPGYFGIREPADDPATLLDPTSCGPDALALVPGLLFDDEGFRLGYGGGFYDRFLPSFPGNAMGLAREAQRVESLQSLDGVDALDCPIHLLATEHGIADSAQKSTVYETFLSSSLPSGT